MMQMSAKALSESSALTGEAHPNRKKKSAAADSTLDFSALLGMQSALQPMHPAGLTGHFVKTAHADTAKDVQVHVKGTFTALQPDVSAGVVTPGETPYRTVRLQTGAGQLTGLFAQPAGESSFRGARAAGTGHVTSDGDAATSAKQSARVSVQPPVAAMVRKSGSQVAKVTGTHPGAELMQTSAAGTKVPTTTAMQTPQVSAEGLNHALAVRTAGQVQSVPNVQGPAAGDATQVLKGLAPKLYTLVGADTSRAIPSTTPTTSEKAVQRLVGKQDTGSEIRGNDGQTSVLSSPFMPVVSAHGLTFSPVHPPVTPVNRLESGSHTLNLNDAGAQQKLGSILINQIQAGPDQVQVKVHPEGMGDIVVSVVRAQDGIQLKLEANQMQTSQWLAQQTQQLTNAVRATGIDIQHVEVSFGNANFANQSGQDQPSSRRQRQDFTASKVFGVTGKTTNSAWDSGLQDDLASSGISLRV